MRGREGSIANEAAVDEAVRILELRAVGEDGIRVGLPILSRARRTMQSAEHAQSLLGVVALEAQGIVEFKAVTGGHGVVSGWRVAVIEL